MKRKLLAALAAVAVSTAAQAAVLTYSGYLQDASGAPVTATTTITFRFYAADTGGTALWQEDVPVLPNADGWFSAILGATTPLDEGIFQQPAWLGLQVATDAQEMTPRTQIGAAPAALTVAWAGITGKPATFPVDPAAVQSRVTGACGTGWYMSAVNQDGTVTCAADQVGAGDVTAVLAGAGLTGGGTSGDVTLAVNTSAIQARVTGTCAAGGAIRAIDAAGAVTCQADTNTTYVAGSGLALSGTTFAVDGAVVARKDASAGSQFFDGNTLVLDYGNNRVGIGTGGPAHPLEVVGNAAADDFVYRAGKTRYFSVNAVTFTNTGTTPTTTNVSFAYAPGGGQWSLVAPVNLPSGAQVTALTCEVYDADGATDFGTGVSFAYLASRQYGQSGYNLAFQNPLNTPGTVSGSVIRTATGVLTIDNASFEYWLWVILQGNNYNGSGLRFYGCRLAYTAYGPY